MVDYATITGKITVPDGDVGIRARIIATPLTVGHGVTLADRIAWGPARTETAADGTFTDLKVPLAAEPVLWQIVADPITKEQVVEPWDLGVYEITASAALHDLVPTSLTGVAPSVIVSIAESLAASITAATSSAASATSAAASAALADQIALGDADAALAAAIANPASASGAALSASTGAFINALTGDLILSPEALWAAKVDADLPEDDEVTITVISQAEYTGTPSLGVVDGVLVTPARIGTSTGPLDFDGDPNFRYSGGIEGNGVDTSWVGPGNAIANCAMSLHPEFMTSRGIDKVMVKVRPTTTTLAYRVTIGEIWEQAELHRTTVSANGTYYIVLDLAVARSRRIKVELLAAQFGGAVIPADEYLTRPPDRQLYVAIGDSFTAGANLPPVGASGLETSPNYVAYLLGMDYTSLSKGGTGWDPDEDDSYATRIPAALNMGPFVLHPAGSRNDDTSDGDVYLASAPALKSATTVPYVFVTGPAQTGFELVNDAVRDAATEAGVLFGDVLGVITNADTGTPTDSVHPSFEGHQKLARAFLDLIQLGRLQTLLSTSQRSAAGVTLSASPESTSEDGEDVTLNATIDPSLPGRVEFRAGTALLGSVVAEDGSAELTTDELAIGLHQISARFVPADRSHYRPSVSEYISYAVVPELLSDIILTNLLTDALLGSATLNSTTDAANITSLTPVRGTRTEALTNSSGSNRMVYMTNEGDGLPALKQTSIQFLSSPDWASSLPAGSALTVFVVFKIVTMPSANSVAILYSTNTNSGLRLQGTSSGAAALSLIAQNGVTVPNQIDRTGEWQVWGIRVNADSTATVFQNRLTGDTFNVSHGSMAYDGQGIGYGSATGATGAEIRHRGFAAYSGAMDNNAMHQMMVFLADEFNVTLDNA